MIKKEYKNTIGALLVLFLLSILLNFLPLNLTEPDNVFHIASASIYKENGPWFSDFHWENFSVFKTYKSDMWYGFHLLLSLFIFDTNYLLAVQMAGAFLTFVFLALLYLFLKKIDTKNPLLWTLILLISSSNEFLRYIDLRPHILISAITVVFVYFLTWKRDYRWLFLTSILFTFVEISMIWLPIGLAGLYFVSLLVRDLIQRSYLNLKPLFYRGFITTSVVFIGVILGGMLRPNFMDGFSLFYYQIVYLYLLKAKMFVFPYVSELYPIDKNTLISISPIIFTFVVAFLVWVIERSKEKEVKTDEFLFFSAISSFFFLAVTIFSSIRAIDFFTLFSVPFVSIVLTKYSSIIPIQIKQGFIFKSAVVIFIFCLGYSSVLSVFFYRYNFGTTVEKYKNVAEFLRNNSTPGSVVANLTFDDYPGLFLWNRSNIYINHSDTVFQYAYNEKVSNEFFCSINKLSSTNDVFGQRIDSKKMQSYCQGIESRDLLEILMKDFNATYVFLGEGQPYFIIKYLLNDKKLKPVYADEKAMVFKVR